MTAKLAILCLVLLSGCAVPAPKAPPAPDPTAPLPMLNRLGPPSPGIGQSIITYYDWGYYFTNPVTGLSGNVLAQPVKDHVEILLATNLVRVDSPNGEWGYRFAVLSADLYGSTNLADWYYIDRIRQGWPVNRPLRAREFYRLKSL